MRYSIDYADSRAIVTSIIVGSAIAILAGLILIILVIAFCCHLCKASDNTENLE